MANVVAVVINGYQSHTASAFQLGPGLNVITGPSDAGKTAILRALRWVAFGEPSGEAFVNEAIGEATVIVKLGSGLIITKNRRKGKTTYILQTDPGDEGTKFEKAEVPEEVKAALGITKQSFGDFVTSLNFAYQLEAPFLLSEPPSTGAKVLGKLAKVEPVDGAIKDTAKDTYAARQKRSQAEKNVERTEEQLKEFAELDKLKDQLDACEYIVKEIDQAYGRKEALTKLSSQLDFTNRLLESVSNKLEQLSIVPSLEKDLQDIEKAQKRYDTLLGLYGQLGKTTATVEKLTLQLELYQGLESTAEKLTITEVESQRLTSLITLYSKHQKYKFEIVKTTEIVEKTKELDIAVELLTAVDTQLVTRLDHWKQLRSQYTVAHERTERFNRALETVKGIDEASSILESLDVAQGQLQTLYDLRNRFDIKTRTVQTANSNLNNALDQEKYYSKELTTIWAEVDVCPLCEQPVTEGGPC